MDNMTGVTEIASVSATIIESMVQDYLQQAIVIAPSLKAISAPKGAKEVDIGRLAGFTVDDKSEGVAVSAQALTWSADALALNQHKVIQVLVEDIAKLQSTPDLMANYAERMGADIANAIDAYVYSELVKASASAPDHRIAFAGSTIAATDLLEARRLLNVQNVSQAGRYLVINPSDEKALLSIDNFVRADAYGSAAGLQNGELGRIFGFTVLMSNNATYSVAYHQSACAVAIQQSPRYQEQTQLEYLASRASLDVIFGAKILDSGKRCVKLGSAS
jgi:N4-gp56 family major capsid protein